MKVLVTGGAGFIGSYVIDELIAHGHTVRALDHLRQHPLGGSQLPPGVEFLNGDVTSPHDLRQALAGQDAIVHLAAYQYYLKDFSQFIRVNAESMALLFELITFASLPIRKIVYASSFAVVGEGEYRCPRDGYFYKPGPRSLDQLKLAAWDIACPTCGGLMTPLPNPEHVINPHTPYGISKYTSELLAQALGARFDIPTVGLRYTYVQGSRPGTPRSSGIGRVFASRLAQGLPPICYEDGHQLRDLIHVTDCATATVLALEEDRANGRVFHVGSGRAISVLGFAQLLAAVMRPALTPVVSGEFRVGDTRHGLADSSALRALGWTPEATIDEIVAEAVDAATVDGSRGDADMVMRRQGVLRPSSVTSRA